MGPFGPGSHVVDKGQQHMWTTGRNLKTDSHLLSCFSLQRTDKQGAGISGIAFGFGLLGESWVFVICGRDEPGDEESHFLPNCVVF